MSNELSETFSIVSNTSEYYSFNKLFLSARFSAIKDNSSYGPLKIAPAYLSGAMYNYFFVEHDLSLGVHNTLYTHQLLESSIAELTAE